MFDFIDPMGKFLTLHAHHHTVQHNNIQQRQAKELVDKTCSSFSESPCYGPVSTSLFCPVEPLCTSGTHTFAQGGVQRSGDWVGVWYPVLLCVQHAWWSHGWSPRGWVLGNLLSWLDYDILYIGYIKVDSNWKWLSWSCPLHEIDGLYSFVLYRIVTILKIHSLIWLSTARPFLDYRLFICRNNTLYWLSCFLWSQPDQMYIIKHSI